MAQADAPDVAIDPQVAARIVGAVLRPSCGQPRVADHLADPFALPRNNDRTRGLVRVGEQQVGVADGFAQSLGGQLLIGGCQQ
ncbi:hypothetical protein D3C78_1419080 [compost metagenome]